MNILKCIAAALVAVLLSTPAQAALLLGTQGSGANLVTDYSASGLVSFNLEMGDASHVSLRYEIEEADLAGPLGLSAMILNMRGVPFSQFNFAVNGITFMNTAGSVTPAFGSVGDVGASASLVHIGFAAAEPAEFNFGNPLRDAGLNDWLLDTAGLRAGDVFTVTAFVPEPSSVALMLPLLAGLVAARRRSKR